MFSLVIVLISIALVAALALASLYYGGSAYQEGGTDAAAAKVVNQGQQILAADRLYRLNHAGTAPPNMQSLVDGGYLSTIPVALGDTHNPHTVALAPLPSAIAAAVPWQMVAEPGVRAYVLPAGTVDSEVCATVNWRAAGTRGISTKVYANLRTQCYGNAENALVVAVVADTEALASPAMPHAPTVLAGGMPTDASSPDWLVPPAALAGDGGGGGGGSAPVLGAFAVPEFLAVGDAPFALAPPASTSPGAWTFSSSNPAVATISGNTVTPTGGGTATILAAQAAAGGFSAGSASAALNVSMNVSGPAVSGSGAPVMGEFTVPSSADLGSAPFVLTPPASTSPGAWTFSSSEPSVATVSGSTVTPAGGGTTTIIATQAAAGGYSSGSTSAVFSVSVGGMTIAPAANPVVHLTVHQQAYITFTLSNPSATAATVSSISMGVAGTRSVKWDATTCGPAVVGSLSTDLMRAMGAAAGASAHAFGFVLTEGPYNVVGPWAVPASGSCTFTFKVDNSGQGAPWSDVVSPQDIFQPIVFNIGGASVYRGVRTLLDGTVVPGPVAILNVSGGGAFSIAPGQSATFSITASNTGSATAAVWEVSPGQLGSHYIWNLGRNCTVGSLEGTTIAPAGGCEYRFRVTNAGVGILQPFSTSMLLRTDVGEFTLPLSVNFTPAP